MSSFNQTSASLMFSTDLVITGIKVCSSPLSIWKFWKYIHLLCSKTFSRLKWIWVILLTRFTLLMDFTRKWIADIASINHSLYSLYPIYHHQHHYTRDRFHITAYLGNVISHLIFSYLDDLYNGKKVNNSRIVACIPVHNHIIERGSVMGSAFPSQSPENLKNLCVFYVLIYRKT